LRWESAIAKHRDCFNTPRLNLWRDFFPPQLENDLMGRSLGEQTHYSFAPGELVEPMNSRQYFRLKPHQFNQRFGNKGLIPQRNGRFYPRGMLQELSTIFAQDCHPFRLIAGAAAEAEFYADLNHPLASYPLDLQVTITGIWAQGEQRGGRSQDVAALLTANGPGMQTRWRDQPTDFWSDMPFMRRDCRSDLAFYDQPRLIAHLDQTAQDELAALHGQLLAPNSQVLDLMSSWQTHLPEELALAELVGLGMNAAELDANPRLTERVVHDLNAMPQLPFAAAQFDAVICSLSIEYLIEPIAVLREVARVLKPCGVCVIGFSNRWFPTKAIQLWEGIHEFERPGLILEYFLAAGGFTELETFSVRGLPRPANDKYADQMALSDPIYAVWGRRSAD
jgi:SAM-dependent methyltransferase